MAAWLAREGYASRGNTRARDAVLREARQWISYQGIFRRDVLTQFSAISMA